MTNYQALIDQEIWAFIERTNSWYPADAVERSVDEQRAIYTAMCRAFFNGYPSGVEACDAVIESNDCAIPVRRYNAVRPKLDAHVVYIHGGGFVVGDLDSHDDVCAELCNATSLGITSIDYRLAPEHKHPAAFNDCVSAVRFEAARLMKPLLLCGDSAGGNLCAAVAHAVRADKTQAMISGQVLIYPTLGAVGCEGSFVTHANAPMLTCAELDYYAQVRVDDKPLSNDVTFAPLQDQDFTNLPRTLVVSAECDPLSDDGRLYCEAINNAGGQAQWRNERGLVHGYLRARHASCRARASFAAIVAGLSDFAQNTSQG